MTQSFDAAIAALRNGQPLEAERIASEGLERARRDHPPESLVVCQAHFDLASILLGVGDLGRAINHMRSACALDEDTDDARRERLTFLMNLGELLQRGGELDEAESVLREGLEGRRAFYGADHPGYAFGLEPLGEVLLSLGRAAHAEPVLRECVEVFSGAAHPRLPGAMILEAAAKKTIDRKGASLTRLAGADRSLLSEVVSAALDKSSMALDGHYDPGLWLELLTELRELLVDGGWTDADALTRLVIACSNLARRAGRHESQVAAFRWLIAHLDSSGQSAKTLDALQGLALAQSQAGDEAEAEATYREAAKRAESTGALAHSQALRNFGLYLAELERRSEAAPLLQQAVGVARSAWGGGGAMLGRALVALGIFVQHGGDEDPDALRVAKGHLEEGISKLPPDHPDGLPARSHLDAIERGAGCGCGNMDAAISQALTEMVRQDLPEGLLASISYSAEGGLQVDLARAPVDEREREHLDRVVHQALARLQAKIRGDQ